MIVMLPFFSNFNLTGEGTALLFELGCGPTKNDCLEARSTRGVVSAIGDIYGGLTMVIARDISRDVINRIAKVELQLCACHGDNPVDESPLHGNDDELNNINFPNVGMRKLALNIHDYET